MNHHDLLRHLKIRASMVCFPIDLPATKMQDLSFPKPQQTAATFQETMQMLQEEVGPFKEVKGFRCAMDHPRKSPKGEVVHSKNHILTYHQSRIYIYELYVNYI